MCIVAMHTTVAMQLYMLHLKISLLLFKYQCLPINYDPLVENMSPVKSVHGFSCMGFHSKQVHNFEEKSVYTDICI